VPLPSNQASNVPECSGSDTLLLMILIGVCVDVMTQGEEFAAPPSNPRFPNSSVPLPASTLFLQAKKSGALCGPGQFTAA